MLSSASVLSLFLTIAPLGQPAPDADAERRERLKFMQEEAANFALSPAADPQTPFPLRPAPVLRYSNPERERGSSDGATFLWLDGRRPVAALSISMRKPDDLVYCEATCFQASPLVCLRSGAPLWAPEKGGMAPAPLADAPAPGASEPLRLTQMRRLARRFAARCYDVRTDAPTQLRLLPQPLYRYADANGEILDGAVFGFVVSNDPELLLLLEARRAAEDRPAHWRYALARMSSHKESVELDGQEIWSVPNFHRSGESKTAGPYIESRIGVYLPE